MNRYKELAQTIETLLEQGNVADAVRISGEALAESDARWTARYNAGENAEAELVESNLVGTLHVEALLQAGCVVDSFSTAMMLLLRAVNLGSDSVANYRSCMQIAMLAATAEMIFMESVPEPDDDLANHSTIAFSMLVTLLYNMYVRVRESDPAYPGLPDAYEFLNRYRAAIITEPFTPAGSREAINPADSRALLAEAAGRARAISLFVVDGAE